MNFLNEKKELSIERILEDVMFIFNERLRSNVYEYGLNADEINKRLQEKKQLRTMLKNCTYGDLTAKDYIRNNIMDIIMNKYGSERETINQIIPFDNADLMSPQDIFESVLYLYKLDYNTDALDRLINDYNLDRERYTQAGNVYYEIDEDDIRGLLKFINLAALGTIDRLKIISQRIYQLYKGNGAIDEIRDMRVDGVSAGVSGISEELKDGSVDNYRNNERKSFNSIWIFYHGKSIFMSFLGFGCEKELVRVCKNIYKYNNPGQLTCAKGYIVNEMFDGSRVSVARPPFCESWVMFIRKFDSVRLQGIESLITDDNSALPIQLIWWLIKGQMVTGITGQQGSGKTTLLMSVIDFIEPSYNLRIQEMSFELHLRRIYPNRNIVSFKETGSVSGQEGLDFAKKTDGTVNILGEVATAPVASWLIQMAGVGSLFTLFTHHAKTTKDLVVAMRNALLTEGGFSNERVATEQVCMALDFDIHMVRDRKGHRYIERITQIIPMEDEDNSSLTGGMFKTKDIVRYVDGSYKIAGGLTKDVTQRICSVLTGDEKEDFLAFAMDLNNAV